MLRPHGLHRSAWSVISLAASALVYHPLTRNYFYADDFLNLFSMRNLPLAEYLLMPHGGHVLVTRNALFYFSSQAFGVQASYYFWVVLLTHLLNVFLLFRAVQLFTGSARLACFGATLWGTSPVHEGSLGWYSVYGHIVVGTFMLVILCQVGRLAAGGTPPSRRMQRLWYTVALAASTSFGIGMGVALALPLLLMMLLPGWRRWSRWRVPLVSLIVVVPALYVGLHRAYGLLVPEAGQLPEAPDILVAVALENWRAVLPMLFHLIAYGATRLVLGFFAPPHYSNSSALAVASVLFGGCALTALDSQGLMRRALAASAVLTTACYGMIALGRVKFFREAQTVELVVSQGRYHYVGLLVLTLLLCMLLARAGFWLRLGPRAKTALLLAWLGFWAVAYARSGPGIDHHDDARKGTAAAVAWMRARIDATPAGRDVYIQNQTFAPVGPLFIPPTVFPGWAGVFTIFFPDNTIDGRRVFFVERHSEVIEAHRRGRRTATLLVPPERAPGANR